MVHKKVHLKLSYYGPLFLNTVAAHYHRIIHPILDTTLLKVSKVHMVGIKPGSLDY